ncbi:hypothetical protein CBW65_05350 [Tumebacillus avium]|uniref:Uncharacterized protein n=1 Tax=Tumebacillus avium TaxID=1903704 RepID=A0A1Y0IL53_9BACL|nr:hypothetical protein CBW65_05350 [Tumebacillus avium]
MLVERLLVKTAVYSFFSWFALIFLFTPNKKVIRNGSIEEITYRAAGEYLHSLLWMTTLFTVLTVLIALLFMIFSKSSNQQKK